MALCGVMRNDATATKIKGLKIYMSLEQKLFEMQRLDLKPSTRTSRCSSPVKNDATLSTAANLSLFSSKFHSNEFAFVIGCESFFYNYAISKHVVRARIVIEMGSHPTKRFL